jgi:hypothetical protein
MLTIENEKTTTWKVLWFDATDTPIDEMLTLGYISIKNGKTQFTAANEIGVEFFEANDLRQVAQWMDALTPAIASVASA